MSALRMGNSKESLIQGMKLLQGLLEVMSKPDAKKLLQEAIVMSEDEMQTAHDARVYVENAERLKSEIAAERTAADQQITEATRIISDAKNAQAQSKKTLGEHETRLQAITDKHNKKDADHAAKDAFHAQEDQRLNKLSAYLSEQANKQESKQKQLAELEEKLRGKAAQAAEIMKGV